MTGRVQPVTASADATRQAGHALEHPSESRLLAAEADEHRPVFRHGPIRHVPAKDLPELILIRARDVGVRGLVLELGGIGLAAPDHELLAFDGQ